MSKKMVIFVLVFCMFSIGNAKIRVIGGYNMAEKFISTYANMSYQENSTGAMVYGIEYVGDLPILKNINIDSYSFGYKKTAKRSIPNMTWNGTTYTYTPVSAEAEFDLFYLNLNHMFLKDVILFAGVNFPYGFRGLQPNKSTFSTKIGFQVGLEYLISKNILVSIMYENVDLGRKYPNTSGNVEGYSISGIELLLKYQF